MAFMDRLPLAVVVCAAAAFSQQAPIVQPGAPGTEGKTLTPAAAAPKPRTPQQADIYFMQGMIHHHSQAVEMVDLLRTRTNNPRLRAFGDRISISQTDEIEFMKQWLRERNQPTMMPHAPGHDMSSMPLMPGMLTAEQMKALAKASGPA